MKFGHLTGPYVALQPPNMMTRYTHVMKPSMLDWETWDKLFPARHAELSAEVLCQNLPSPRPPSF